MKNSRIGILLIVLILGTSAFAQQPEDIGGIARESKTADYYKEQVGLWKTETQKDSKNAHAWYMLYKAQRAYFQKSDYQAWLASRSEVFIKLQPIITEAKKSINGTYEYFLMESLNTDSKESIVFVKKAYAIDPSRTETYEPLLVDYVKTDNVAKAKEVSQKMLASNYYSNANYKWNYNALQTVDKNGVFITQGDNDSMPRWILQFGLGIRQDVTVVNLWMMYMLDEYRELSFAKMGVPPMKQKRSDFKADNDFVNAIMIHILKTCNKPTYVGCGTDVNIFKQGGVMDYMYLVGMAFRYSETKIDNLALIKRNFEQNYELEYLFNEFQVHSEDEMVKQFMNLTYIPGIVKMKNHYSLAGDKLKCEYYDELFDRIAKMSGREEEIKSWYQ